MMHATMVQHLSTILAPNAQCPSFACNPSRLFFGLSRPFGIQGREFFIYISYFNFGLALTADCGDFSRTEDETSCLSVRVRTHF